MIKLFLLTIFTITMQLVLAQIPKDTIEIKKSGFLLNGKQLKPKQLLEITKSNAISFDYMQKAQKNWVPASILGAIGGGLVGFPLGSVIAGGKMNWTLLGVGAGLIVVSLPLSSAYFKYAKKAVLEYNQGLQKTGYNKVFLQSTISANGIGIKATF